MKKIALLISACALSFITQSSVFAGSCPPAVNADGSVTVLLYNAAGSLIYDQHLMPADNARHKGGILIDRITYVKMTRSKSRNGKIFGRSPAVEKGKTLFHDQTTATFDVYHTGGAAVASIGGCQLTKVRLVYPTKHNVDLPHAISAELKGPLDGVSTVSTLSD